MRLSLPLIKICSKSSKHEDFSRSSPSMILYDLIGKISNELMSIMMNFKNSGIIISFLTVCRFLVLMPELRFLKDKRKYCFVSQHATRFTIKKRRLHGLKYTSQTSKKIIYFLPTIALKIISPNPSYAKKSTSLL